ncbi:MAG: family transcriptional regulator [Patescibacteria group bacterium]|jgi:DNA-binding Xre family transcriptional regulator|nr:family transcriptional regulator [Patescibacteria group bacterium]RTK93594.1 MAG: XRE family transcriptional regulator [Candidatus Saccharibacteria bacterium]
MKNAKLKQQFKSVIALHFDRELWHSRPELSYDKAIEPFVDDLIRVASYHKRDWKYKSYLYDEIDLFSFSVTTQNIGERIKEVRLRKGWSLTKLAKKAEIDSSYLDGVERGEPILRIWALETILEALGVKSSKVLPF